MQPAVAPIGNGKHDENEDEGANELERGNRMWNSFNAQVHFGKDRDLTSSKKQFAEDM